TERMEFLVREIDTLEAVLRDPWEKAEKLEALVSSLTELDQELIKAGIDLRKDEAKDQGENSVEEIVVEEEAVPEPELVLEFDIHAILQRIDEIHATMTLPVYAEEELIAVPTVVPDAIPVTQEAVEQLESQAESAALMAGFTRSILSGGTGQMSIDDFLEIPVKPTAPRKGLTKAQKKDGRGTADSVLNQPISKTLPRAPVFTGALHFANDKEVVCRRNSNEMITTNWIAP
ncbi:MAG TPA: hypothetical protein VK171_02005, partial [Fimbriimonas sp.]|nr:hypothetical protein [Fimbriimonas sp.]